MRYGIFSDVHSNLEAFEAVLSAYEKEGIDKYLCVGDIVGYAANPCECLKLVKKFVSVCVAGNHDWAATGKFDPSYFNTYAKAALADNAQKLSRQDKEYLNNLQLVFSNKDLTLVHGSLDDPGSFNYLTDSLEALATFRLMKSSICFVGHTHIPQVFEFTECSSISQRIADNFKIRKNNKYIVNVGSVGQPRDGDPRAVFSVFDTDKMEVFLGRVDYDFKNTQKKIFEAGLPRILASRLSNGM